MAGSRKELGELTELVDTTSAAYGIEVSTEKSKIMAIATEKTQPVIKVRGKTLEQVQSFKYLGTQITKDGFPEYAREQRICIQSRPSRASRKR